MMWGAVVWLVFLTTASALDVVTLKDGRVVKGELSYVADDQLKIRMMIAGPRGSGSTMRNLPMERVAWIDFEAGETERELEEDPESVPLDEHRRLWAEEAVLLEQPKSPAGSIGLLYGKRLVRKGGNVWLGDAMEVYRMIEERDWSELRRGKARVGRLRVLMALGRAEEAVVEAEEIAEETEDPGLLIEARYILALAAFEKLRGLEDENPRWEDDDEVRPVREELFNETIDRHLFAFLRFGSEEEVAARGLWGAREVYEFGGEWDKARECVRDIVELYGDSDFGAKAEAYLNRKTNEDD